ncbi:MAG: hypothetical protein ACRDP4_03050 [Nocardioidaceae bacterium]
MHATAGGTSATQRGPSTDLRELPKSLWVGLVVGVLAFFVTISSHTEERVNGVQTSCSYTDFAALVGALACIICVPAAWMARGKLSRRRQSALWLMAPGSLLLIAFAVVHVLRGLGVVGGPC